MKKGIFKLWVLLLAIVPFLVSCSEDDKLSLGGATIVFDDDEIVVVDGVLSKAITGSITAPAGAEISTYNVTAISVRDGQENQTAVSRTGVTEESRGKYTFRFDGETNGIKENISNLTGIRIDVEVKDGDFSTRSLKIRQEVTQEEEDPNDDDEEEEILNKTMLSDPEDFEWKRVGAAAGTGLEKFGLLWMSNTSTLAIIKADSKTRMVRLRETDWENITTKGQLKRAVDEGDDLDQYDGVSVTSPTRTYNDVLAVDVAGEGVYYIIHVTSSAVLSENTGTTVTVNGQSRN